MYFSETFLQNVVDELELQMKKASATKPYVAALYLVSKSETIKSDGRLIASGRNTELQDGNKIAHGEMNVLNIAKKDLFESYKLGDSEPCLFVNTRPCPMCTAAIVEAGIRDVYFFWDNHYKTDVAEAIIRAKQGAEPITFDVVPSRWCAQFDFQRTPPA